MSEPRAERIHGLLERYSAGDLAAIDELVAPEYFAYVPEAPAEDPRSAHPRSTPVVRRDRRPDDSIDR